MSEQGSTAPSIGLQQLAIATVATAAAAAVINAIIFLIADAAGVWDGIIIENLDGEMKIGPIISLSVIGIIGGAITMFALSQFVGNWPLVFRIVAGIVLVLSFGSPFSVPDGDAAFIIVLEITHIVAGGLAIWALPKFSVAQ